MKINQESIANVIIKSISSLFNFTCCRLNNISLKIIIIREINENYRDRTSKETHRNHLANYFPKLATEPE